MLHKVRMAPASSLPLLFAAHAWGIIKCITLLENFGRKRKERVPGVYVVVADVHKSRYTSSLHHKV